jgi:hypothetical protein
MHRHALKIGIRSSIFEPKTARRSYGVIRFFRSSSDSCSKCNEHFMHFQLIENELFFVMAGLVPAIHVFLD